MTWASLAVTLVMMGGLGTYYQSEKERMAQVQRSTVTKGALWDTDSDLFCILYVFSPVPRVLVVGPTAPPS